MKAIIKDDGYEYKFDRMQFVRIDNGTMTIDYYDEEGNEHQEAGEVPDYIWIED